MAREELRRALPPLWRQYLCGPLYDSWVTKINRLKDELHITVRHWPAEDFAYSWNPDLEPCPIFPVILRFTGVMFAAGRRMHPDGALTWSSWDTPGDTGWICDFLFQTDPTIQFAARLGSHDDLICLIEATGLEISELQEGVMRKTLGDEPAEIWRTLLEESKNSPAGIPEMLGRCCLDSYLVERFGSRFTNWRADA